MQKRCAASAPAVLNPDDLARWCAGSWVGGRPAGVRGVGLDSRTLGAGELFVALSGSRSDGHAFVAQALRGGAAAALVERARLPAGSDPPGPCLVVDNTLRALQSMAAGYRRARGLRIVGVTGSAGKTTVKELIACVLARSIPVARTRGNWNNEIGLPLSLLNMPGNARAGVFEVGVNHPGEMQRLCDILAPDWGVITSIGPVHIEFFGTESAIACEKSRLLGALPDDGVSVICADSPWAQRLRTAARGRLVSVALDGAADYRITACADDPQAVCMVEHGRPVQPFRPPLPGRHNLLNALLAVAVARTWGMEWPDILDALRDYRGAPMRWERTQWRGAVVINDAYNANPLSVAAALATFAELPAKRKWLVLGDMYELGAQSAALHAQVGRRVAACPWLGLVTVGPLAAGIADAAVSGGMPAARILRCASPTEAAGLLAPMIEPGDHILLKGSRGVGLEKFLEYPE